MRIKIFQVDAFTDRLFGGNPAAVCPLDKWLPDELLQQIAIENNLAETVFFVKLPSGAFHIRWFTPEHEIDLCGHATLASAFVLFDRLGHPGDRIDLESVSGPLSVKRVGELLELDFPSRPPQPAQLPELIQRSLNIAPKEVWKARDYVLVYQDEQEVLDLQPDAHLLDGINIAPAGLVATACSKSFPADFISRYFTPQASVFEDPATGSAHCSLVPFWAERMGKTELEALQVSRRQGTFSCNLTDDRVLIRGEAVLFLEGEVVLDVG